jgi:hypothetical protein
MKGIERPVANSRGLPVGVMHGNGIIRPVATSEVLSPSLQCLGLSELTEQRSRRGILIPSDWNATIGEAPTDSLLE